MKLGLAMEEYQGLQTHLNLRRDFTGSFDKMSNTISSGRSSSCFVLRRRIAPPPFIWDIFQRKKRHRRVCVLDSEQH